MESVRDGTTISPATKNSNGDESLNSSLEVAVRVRVSPDFKCDEPPESNVTEISDGRTLSIVTDESFVVDVTGEPIMPETER